MKERKVDFISIMDELMEKHRKAIVLKNEAEQAGLNSNRLFCYEILLSMRVLLQEFIELAEVIYQQQTLISKAIQKLQEINKYWDNKIVEEKRKVKTELFNNMLKKI